ncbi:hypothetical protein NUW54_g148 [Trametes sanguinea]|uniref:Uncharacterized protein n=1 Tax=Trametes sanguinea TaxID=158606 RepID=A0ACC1QBF3_9APHY|nr:hypothetical protein NUW54_g148 [Trametes sanguinea]
MADVPLHQHGPRPRCVDTCINLTRPPACAGNKVSVAVDTLYPFSDSLATTITAEKDFTYYVRVPSWVSKGTIAINGAKAKAVTPSNGLQAVPVKAGTTKFTLNLPSDITIGTAGSPKSVIVRTVLMAIRLPAESRPHSSVAVHRGPLHYAFDIARSQKVLQQNAQQPLAKDLEFDATANWQLALGDPKTFVFNGGAPEGGNLPSPVFDSGLPPFTITAQACPIEWEVAGDTFAASPPENPECAGPVQNITLWPFGATKLRIGEFPTFKAN